MIKKCLLYYSFNYRDVYAIGENRDFITTQRNIAILEYARQTRKSVFIYSDGLLKRQSLNGYLPFPIAQWLRQSTGLQSGPVIVEQCPVYQYPIEEAQLNTLQTILGVAIEGKNKIKPKNLIRDIGRQRHRGNRTSYF